MDVPVAAAKCLGLEDGDLCRVWPVFFAPIASAVRFTHAKRRLGRCFRAKRTSGRVFVETTSSAYEGMLAFFPSVKAGGKPIVLKCIKVEALVKIVKIIVK